MRFYSQQGLLEPSIVISDQGTMFSPLPDWLDLSLERFHEEFQMFDKKRRSPHFEV